MRIGPYLNFNGDCREAFAHYEQVLRRKIQDMITHGDMPIEGTSTDPGWQQKILHAHLTVGDYEIMGSDCPPEYYTAPRNMYVALQLNDTAEAERIYAGLEDGATIEMPLGETPWAKRFAMLTDRYGVPWLINCDTQ